MAETIGDRIRIVREKKGMTQEKLAQAADISKGFLSDVENGKRSISAENVLRIANVLGASLEYLMRGTTAVAEEHEPVQIPPELSKAAEDLNLSYSDTLNLLRAEQSIIARRGGKGKRNLDVADWKDLYSLLKKAYKIGTR